MAFSWPEVLLNSEALDRWRIAAQSDFDVSSFLGHLHLVDSDSESSEPSEERLRPHDLKARQRKLKKERGERKKDRK